MFPRMNPELINRLAPFRAEALRRGIPLQDVERWIATARPSGTLVTGGDGPVVGRFGGPLLLPADAPDPWTPLLATLDCAALPEETTGLALPADGKLLLFGFPEMTYYGGSAGDVVYLPEGTPVEERRPKYESVYDDATRAIHEQFPQEELRLAPDVCLPSHFLARSPETGEETVTLPGHPHAWELAEAWEETYGDIVVDGPLHIGGYASHECTETDPVTDAVADAEQSRRVRAEQSPGSADTAELPAAAEWVLLAQWDIGLDGREGSTLHWVIPRQDLAERRFDRAHVSFFWNP
jgi:nucleotide-binding universal stress UspA family protein